ncbi:hypothetical protein LguiA_034556 [Lonicera macranthoides]
MSVVRIVDNELPFESHDLYDVFLDDTEIETLVTHDPSMVKSWIANIEHLHHRRLHRLIVGLDVEWRPNLTKNKNKNSSSSSNPVAILQLCVAKSCLVFQILRAPKIPKYLLEFLTDPDYTFVGVGIERDLERLSDDYELDLEVNSVDLRKLAAKELDRRELRNMGLKGLAKEIMGKQVCKMENVRMSKWDKRHLKLNQVAYAAIDAYLSFELGRLLHSWY